MLDGHRYWLANTRSHIREQVLGHDEFRQFVDIARTAGCSNPARCGGKRQGFSVLMLAGYQALIMTVGH